MNEPKQLVTKDKIKVNPKSFINAIRDLQSGTPLEEILDSYNMYFVPWKGSIELTRAAVPTSVRRRGLWISFLNENKDALVNEYYNIDDLSKWTEDSSWKGLEIGEIGEIIDKEVKEAIKTNITKFNEAVKVALDTLNNTASTASTGINLAVTQAKANLNSAATTATNSINTTVTTKTNEINSTVTTAKKDIKDAVDEAKEDVEELTAITEGTYTEIKALVDGNKLVPEKQYRITGYTLKPFLEFRSAGNKFDIIVTAATTNTFYAKAKTAPNKDVTDKKIPDEDFAGLEILYAFTNESSPGNSKYNWYSSSQEGIIYWMKDANGNEAPWDFKNMMFPCQKITDASMVSSTFNDSYVAKLSSNSDIESTIFLSSDYTYFYTFSLVDSSGVTDGSCNRGQTYAYFTNNKIMGLNGNDNPILYLGENMLIKPVVLITDLRATTYYKYCKENTVNKSCNVTIVNGNNCSVSNSKNIVIGVTKQVNELRNINVRDCVDVICTGFESSITNSSKIQIENVLKSIIEQVNLSVDGPIENCYLKSISSLSANSLIDTYIENSSNLTIWEHLRYSTIKHSNNVTIRSNPKENTAYVNHLDIEHSDDVTITISPVSADTTKAVSYIIIHPGCKNIDLMFALEDEYKEIWPTKTAHIDSPFYDYKALATSGLLPALPSQVYKRGLPLNSYKTQSCMIFDEAFMSITSTDYDSSNVLDLSTFDFSHAVSMRNMFADGYIGDITWPTGYKINTNCLTDISSMFAALQDVSNTNNTIDLKGFNISNLEYANEMFANAMPSSSFSFTFDSTTSPSKYLDAPNIKNFNSMFYNSAVTTADLYLNVGGTKDVPKQIDLSQMFEGCTQLNNTQMFKRDNYVKANCNSMFKGCSAATSLDIDCNLFITDAVSMFEGCLAVTSLSLNIYKFGFTSNNTAKYKDMFKGCDNLTSVDIQCSGEVETILTNALAEIDPSYTWTYDGSTFTRS